MTNSMQSIYESDPAFFEEFSKHEDYNNNLHSFLDKNFDFNNKTILEMGVGTGRFLEHYLEKSMHAMICDYSSAMLDFCKNKFNGSEKIDAYLANNIDLNSLELKLKPDIIIEAFSFGHTVKQYENCYEAAIFTLLQGCIEKVKPNGDIIIIEHQGLWGKMWTQDWILHRFYAELNKIFDYNEIDTDFLFQTIEEAYYYISRFWDEAMGEKVRTMNDIVIPAKTGIWFKRGINNDFKKRISSKFKTII